MTQVLLQFYYVLQFPFTAVLSSYFILASPSYISNKCKLGLTELLLRHHFIEVIHGKVD
uniref:Uncharacterized protein n=1 Tax=Pelodiscus sinensis TaxID=13735 RepID=K7F0C9_PELSI